MYRYTQLMPRLASWTLHHRSVLLRADLNTTIQPSLSNFKIQAALPTLDYLLQQQALVHLVTHIGSPHAYDAHLSTKPLIAWFSEKGYPIGTHLFIQENIRFHPEETTQDIRFARTLAKYMDFYVNDAFGALHRSDTSLTIVPQLFPLENRSIGLLVERELTQIYALLAQQKPILLVAGGGKYDKLKSLAASLTHIDTLLLCPGLSSALLFPHRYAEELQEPIKLLQQAARAGKVHVPIDYLVSATQEWDPPYRIIPVHEVTAHDVLISIGPATLAQWTPQIKQAEMIIFNGPMGTLHIPDTVHYTKFLIDTICTSTAYRIAGGDSSSELIASAQCTSLFDYISTGGGSLLALLADLPLPGLDALL